jgi:dihydropteroate synthase-like protein
MMRVLIVTGKLAQETIRDQVKEFSESVNVISLPLSVASFITPGYAARALGEMDLEGYDMILLPGNVNGNVLPVEEATGIPTFKGPLHSADIPLVLRSGLKLSKILPASELIKETLQLRAKEEIDEAESDWRRILKEHNGLSIGKEGKIVHVSDGLPMRVIAELVNAPLQDLDTLTSRARYYESMGADIIDIGMLAGDPRPETISPIIKVLRENVEMPISIDTLDPSEIKASVDAGVDLILSVDAGNIDEVSRYIGDEAVVVLPTDMSKGVLPKDALKRVEALELNITHAKSLGLNRIVGDLIVEPLLIPGLLEALKSYRLFKTRNRGVLLLFGIGNATELIDADSVGVNASLTAIAREAGSNMLHVPEYSVKAKGSVNETATASKMMFLAERKGTPPKDLGLDLLILKEKHWIEEEYSQCVEKDAKVVQATGETVFKPDQAGWFKILVDRRSSEIVAQHYEPHENRPTTIIKGRNAREVYQTIVRRRLVANYDHAAYLGKELEKAFIALKLERSYVQDQDLF